MGKFHLRNLKNLCWILIDERIDIPLIQIKENILDNDDKGTNVCCVIRLKPRIGVNLPSHTGDQLQFLLPLLGPNISSTMIRVEGETTDGCHL